MRPDLVLHRDCDSTHCKRSTLAPQGNDATPESFSLSESNMNTEEFEMEELDTPSATSVPEDTSTSEMEELDTTSATSVPEDTSTSVLDDTSGTVEDSQLDDLICHISDTA
jgi:hypothetical protein